MRLSQLAMIAIASSVLATACSKSEPATGVTPRPTQSVAAASPTPDEFAKARSIYAKDCAVCHGDADIIARGRKGARESRVAPWSQDEKSRRARAHFVRCSRVLHQLNGIRARARDRGCSLWSYARSARSTDAR